MQVAHKIRFAIAAAVLLVGAQAVSAQSCQFEKNAIDAITETQVKVTQPVTVAKLNNNPLYFKAQSIGSKYRFLKMRYYKYNRRVARNLVAPDHQRRDCHLSAPRGGRHHPLNRRVIVGNAHLSHQRRAVRETEALPRYNLQILRHNRLHRSANQREQADEDYGDFELH